VSADRFVILNERKQGETRFCHAQDPGTGERVYLIAEPAESPVLPPHCAFRPNRPSVSAQIDRVFRPKPTTLQGRMAPRSEATVGLGLYSVGTFCAGAFPTFLIDSPLSMIL